MFCTFTYYDNSTGPASHGEVVEKANKARWWRTGPASHGEVCRILSGLTGLSVFSFPPSSPPFAALPPTQPRASAPDGIRIGPRQDLSQTETNHVNPSSQFCRRKEWRSWDFFSPNLEAPFVIQVSAQLQSSAGAIRSLDPPLPPSIGPASHGEAVEKANNVLGWGLVGHGLWLDVLKMPFDSKAEGRIFGEIAKHVLDLGLKADFTKKAIIVSQKAGYEQWQDFLTMEEAWKYWQNELSSFKTSIMFGRKLDEGSLFFPVFEEVTVSAMIAKHNVEHVKQLFDRELEKYYAAMKRAKLPLQLYGERGGSRTQRWVGADGGKMLGRVTGETPIDKWSWGERGENLAKDEGTCAAGVRHFFDTFRMFK